MIESKMLHYKYYDFSTPWIKNKTPLVLIHGLGANIETWFAQIPDFAKYFPVIAIDLPGCGNSPELKGDLTIQTLAQTVNKTIKEIVSCKVNLMGISLGAFISVEYASSFPQEVNRLILLSMPYFFNKEIQVVLKKTIEEYKKMTMKEIVESRIGKAFGNLASSEMKQFLIDDILKTKHSVYLQYAKAPIEYDSISKYSQIKAKTLIISGELDYIATPSESKKVQESIVNSSLLILKNTGHALSMENPVELNPKVLKFLRDE